MLQERAKSESGAKPASLSMVASVNKPGTGENRMTDTEAEITGDKHSAASGGVGMSDKKGARIYSDQLTADKELVAKLMKL